MTQPAHITHTLPALLTFAGMLILLAASPLGQSAPQSFSTILYCANVLAWLGTGGLLLYRFKTNPLPLAWLIFGVAVFPFSINSFRIITSESLALAGLLSFITGIIMWKPAHARLERFGGLISAQRHISSKTFMWGCGAVFLVLTVFLSWVCFNFVPAYCDSIAQYIHGKFIASGHLFYIPSHRYSGFFPVWMMVNDGRWYSQYQPLHEILIGLGYMFSAPWLINPLEGALTLVATYAIARRIADEITARISALLFLGCQFVLFMSSEYMNHVTALFFTTLFVLCIIETLESLTPEKENTSCLWGGAAGLCLGAVFLTRPLTAVGIGLPFALYAGNLIVRSPKTTLQPFSCVAAGSLACVVFSLWFNLHTTGQALMFPYARYHGNSITTAMGYYGHNNFLASLSKIHGEWVFLNQSLFEWALPSTFFILVLFATPVTNRYVWLLLAMIVSHTLFDMINQFNSGIFGPRYLYEIASALIILSAAGIRRTTGILSHSTFGSLSPQAASGVTAALVLLLFSGSALYQLPANFKKYSHQYMDNHPVFYNSMLKQSEKPALIFIGYQDAGETPRPEDKVAKYRWVSFVNPPTDDAPVIFAFEQNEKRDRKLMDYYPGRNAYYEHNGILIPIAKDPDEPDKIMKIPAGYAP